MKSDEYRSWQRLPGSERIRAVMDLNLDLYAMKGQAADAPRLHSESPGRPACLDMLWRVRTKL
jgi:hypothetical protein